MTGGGGFVLAGFVAGWGGRRAGQGLTAGLPRVVPTVSDCLAEFLPAGPEVEPWQRPLFEPWHRRWEDAVAAVRQAPPDRRAAHVLSMSAPAPGAAELATMLGEWIGDLPHPVRVNLACPTAAPPGTIRGFEVLGFEAGRFHSWLCYRLDIEARGKLGVRPGDGGLLTTLDDALRVADLANSDRGAYHGTPEEVTWFPALITEHATGQVSAPVGA